MVTDNSKTLIQNLINYYESSIPEIERSKDWNQALKIKDLDCGICRCALYQFETDVYYAPEWVERNVKLLGGIWAKYPREAESKDEAVELLKTRLSILKSELARANNY